MSVPGHAAENRLVISPDRARALGSAKGIPEHDARGDSRVYPSRNLPPVRFGERETGESGGPRVAGKFSDSGERPRNPHHVDVHVGSVGVGCL